MRLFPDQCVNVTVLPCLCVCITAVACCLLLRLYLPLWPQVSHKRQRKSYSLRAASKSVLQQYFFMTQLPSVFGFVSPMITYFALGVTNWCALLQGLQHKTHKVSMSTQQSVGVCNATNAAQHCWNACFLVRLGRMPNACVSVLCHWSCR